MVVNAVNGALSARIRSSSSLPTAHSPSASPRTGRVSMMHLTGCGILGTMVFVVVYMYSIIEHMHREQQAMRMQLAALSVTGQRLRSGGGGDGALRRPVADIVGSPPARDFLSATDAEEDLADPAAGVELEEVEGLYYDVTGSDGSAERRQLSFMATVGTGATDGCYTVTDSATVGFDVSGATTCGSGGTHPCPDCFVTSTMSQDITLTISACSSAKWIRGQSRTGVWTYTFVNPHASQTLTVTDNSGSGKTTYNVPPGTHVQAYCASALGTSNRLYFPSTQLPTLTVDSGITLSAGDFTASASSGAFTTTTGTNTLSGNTVVAGSKTFGTGTGAVSLNGATTVADNIAFTVGSAGSGGAAIFYGQTTVGESSNREKLTVYGAFDQQGASETFSTATGVISLNGDIEVAAGMDFAMATGTGTFTTGAGAVTLKGDTSISGSKTFTTGTGAVAINGATTVGQGLAVTIGTSSNAAGTTTIYGPVVIGGSSSGQTQSLTLYGDFSQADGADGAQTFSTATGAHTLNGDVTVSANNNLHMTASSTGTFQTGAGAVTFNGDTTVSGSKTFTTGTGAVSLNGATTVADNKPLNVGSAGAAGVTQLFGNVLIGSSTSGASSQLEVYGAATFKDDTDGTAKAFTVEATGTSTFYGNVFIEEDKNFVMHNTGTGTFSTGTGAVTINGDTTIASPRTFTIAGQSTSAIGCATGSSFDITRAYCFPGR